MQLSRFQQEVKQNAYRIERISQEINLLLMVDTLLNGVNMDDVSYFSVNQYDKDGPVRVSLTLKDDKRDSKLAHAVVRKVGGTFEKSKSSWNEGTLDMVLTLPAVDGQPEFIIKIEGAVPKTCRIKVTETPLTKEEIEEARKEALENVKLVKVTREIICE